MQIFHNGTNGEINISTGSFTIDSPNTITLNADQSGRVLLSDGATNYGRFQKGGSSWNFHGLVQNNSFRFLGNDGGTETEVMRIQYDGNIGIGTSAPDNTLMVQGASTTGASSTGNVALFEGPSGTNGLKIFIDDTENAAGLQTIASDDLLLNPHGGDVGIGTSSPSNPLDVAGIIRSTSTNPQLRIYTSSGTGQGYLIFGDSADDDIGQIVYNHNTDSMRFHTNASERVRIDSSGNFGIGTSSPNAKLTLQNGIQRINSTDGSSDARIQFSMTDGSNVPTAWVGIPNWNKDALYIYGPTAAGNEVAAFYSNANWVFHTGGTERARIDSSGNLLVGKTSTSVATVGGKITPSGEITATASGDKTLTLNRTTNDGDIAQFRKDNTVVGSIATKDDNLYLGTGDTFVRFFDTDDAIAPVTSAGSTRDNAIDLGTSTRRFKDFHLSGTGYFGTSVGIGTTSPSSSIDVFSSDANIAKFTRDLTTDVSLNVSADNDGTILSTGGVHNFRVFTNNSERARIDSSGNLFVNQTATGDYTDTAGSSFRATGFSTHTRDGGDVLLLNRLSSDGNILLFRKDNSTVGSIGTSGGNLTISGTTNKAGLYFSGNNISPMLSNTRDDNEIDLGTATFRFQDIYATNGTIQTSDINEKQDIEDLSEAETRVAIAAKGLLKKYRWKSAVADKGDDARIHFGIMAQDLENAFANEGLDAGDYGMFISSTWTDEATGEEKTRLGVRYNELLAFIIAAI